MPGNIFNSIPFKSLLIYLMRLIFSILYIVFCLSLNARTHEIIFIDTALIKVDYIRTIVLDTLNPNERLKKDRLTLLAGEKGAAFYSEDSRKNLELSDNPEYLLKILQNPKLYEERSRLDNEAIFRDNTSNTTIVHQRYDLENWELKEISESPTWNIQDSTICILGFNCIMATTNFRGREWTAFFSPDIPLPEGPWKLTGLPGIILKAYDKKKEYSYDAILIDTHKPGLVEYYNYRDRIKINNRIKGLIHRHKVQQSGITSKFNLIANVNLIENKTDSLNVKRYDFEETDYPHQ